MNKEEKAIFNFSFDFEILPKYTPTVIYRYLNEEDMSKILTNDSFIFRFSNIENFDDKTEGRIIVDYYKQSIKELFDEKKINYDFLCKLKKKKYQKQGALYIVMKILYTFIKKST